MPDDRLGEGAFQWAGTLYNTILPSDETRGAISVTDSVSPPLSGPPRHIHHDADETFVILSVDIEFWLDGETVTKAPGEAVFIPRGQEHTFRVVSDTPSRHLVILTPGGFEGFFADMSAGQYLIPEDMAAIEESAERHNLTFTGPPLGA